MVNIVILNNVKSSMIMAVFLVNVDTTLHRKEIASLLHQVVLDMKRVYVGIVFLITSLKEEFVKFRDVTNIQEVIVKNVHKNMILLMVNVCSKIAMIGSMTNV